MITKTYELRNNLLCGMTLGEIAVAIPCFIELTSESVAMYTDDDYVEVTIKCREPDAAYVERKLAAFV